jgi:hypothetical protein
MADELPAEQDRAAQLMARLEEQTRRLREGQVLDAAAEQSLVELVDEVRRVLARTPAASPEAAHLAESLDHLLDALHRPERRGLFEAAADRLRAAAARAEAEAPVATGLVERLLDALANWGI